MKKILLILLLIPINVYGLTVPSRNAILIDQDSGRILYSKKINEKKLIASTTKIMTAMIAIESNKLDEKVKVNDSVLKSYGSGIYIKPGEILTLRDLVYGLLLRSGNDASLMIEDYLGGHDKFINKMNKKAKEIGMNNTIFMNSNGLDDYDEKNYSTVYDMAILMKYANNNYDFREINSTKKYTLSTNMNDYVWRNENKLLFRYKYATGGKTGFTDKARRTLVSSSSRNDVNLIAVTFNDSDDFNTHIRLYEYGFNNYKRYLIINKNKFKVKNEDNLYIKYNYYYLLKENEKKDIETILVKDRKDDIYGYIIVKFKGEEVHREIVYINKEYKKKKLFDY
jgi:D-alanyl-D-alanine carboxypeptidase